ncbi:MAG: tRNA lysidine(34) synthetase TilS, partial [Spirochaetaceae bacterium]|nr:tRNA lysidine(34) synthetase TilS [Spirochaetaceae bacterium]
MKSETIEELKRNLIEKWSASEMRVGIGVSGGPDSMVLLSLLCSICGSEKMRNFSVFVLTIDHNIRKGGVSAADSDFVIDWVAGQKKLNTALKLYAEKQTFDEGLVGETALKRGKGTEEAARFLRYKAFEEFARKHNLNIFCTAHNKNDQLETLIQRFLQGSSPLSSTGIQFERGIFFRPLLSVSRQEILDFARNNKIPYRIDATNNETVYFRNKIRNCLVPFLDEHFEGWQTGVLHGAEKLQDLADSVKADVEAVAVTAISSNKAEIPLEQFSSFDTGTRIQILYKAFVQTGVQQRIPYQAVKKCALTLAMDSYGVFVAVCGSSLVISYEPDFENSFLNVSRKMLAQNESLFSGFFMIIDKCGIYHLHENLEITVQKEKNDTSFGPFDFPLVIRNRQSADKIRSAD